MLYFLDETELENLQRPFFFRDGEARPFTTLKHLDSVSPKIKPLLSQSLYDVVAQWTYDNSYLIYDYYLGEQIDLHQQPKHVIFPQQLSKNLYKDTTLYYGDRTQAIFYLDYDKATDQISNPVVKIDYNYVRDENYYCKYAERTFSWMLKSGQWSADTFKDIVVFHSLRSKLQELQHVRANIIEESQTLAQQLGLLAETMLIYSVFETEVNLYEKAGSIALSNAITNASGPEWAWLENPTTDGLSTIRNFLSQFFSIGVINNA